MRLPFCVLIITLGLTQAKILSAENSPPAPPLSQEQVTALVNSHSRQGDELFFKGDFVKAVASYEKMSELNPTLDASHWRLGIAYFYAGHYQAAAEQFEKYHSFDNVDRENGIWRFFSQKRANGHEQAQKDLLRYEKDDREPFPGLYQMFQGKQTPEQVLKSIEQAELSEEEKSKRLFYAHLYIGLNEALYDRDASALPHLKLSTASKWPQDAGYGPNYMWNVGRLHLELLEKKAAEQKLE